MKTIARIVGMMCMLVACGGTVNPPEEGGTEAGISAEAGTAWCDVADPDAGDGAPTVYGYQCDLPFVHCNTCPERCAVDQKQHGGLGVCAP